MNMVLNILKVSTATDRNNFRKIIFGLLALILVNCKCLASSCQNVYINSDSIKIRVYYKEAKDGDTLTMVLNNNLYDVAEKNNLGSLDVVSRNGVYDFKFAVDKDAGYFSLYKSRTRTYKGIQNRKYNLINPNLWERGDSVTIQLSNKETFAGVYSKCSYSGNGSKKYELNYLIDSTLNNLPADTQSSFNKKLQYHRAEEEFTVTGLKMLESQRRFISPLSYNIIKADLIFRNSNLRFESIESFFDKEVLHSTSVKRLDFLRSYSNTFENPDVYEIQNTALSISKAYLSFLYRKFLTDSYLYKGKYDPDWVYQRIKTKTTGSVRDYVVTYFFINATKSIDANRYYYDAEKFITDKTCRQALSSLQMAAPGKPMETFTLPDVNGKFVSLSDFKGKSMVIDFWFNGCGGCAKLYQEVLSKMEAKFRNNPSVAFVTINGDPSRIVFKKGLETGLYTSKENINLYTNGEGYKHPLIIHNNASFPCVILVDKNGIIRYFNSVNLYNTDSLFEAIKSMI